MNLYLKNLFLLSEIIVRLKYDFFFLGLQILKKSFYLKEGLKIWKNMWVGRERVNINKTHIYLILIPTLSTLGKNTVKTPFSKIASLKEEVFKETSSGS